MSRDVLTPEPYVLDDDFEQTVVVLACRSVRFWQRVGYELEPDLMPSAPAKLAMRTARMVAAESGLPSLVRVRQRLTSLYEEGKISSDKFTEVIAYLSFVPAAGDYEDVVVAELAPLLKRRYAQRIAISAAGEYATGVAFEATKDLVDKFEAIGEDKNSTVDTDGVGLDDDDVVSRIQSMVLLEKLPWGVPEVDQTLRGGPGRGCSTMLLGSTGDGKTKGLCHAACTGLRAGLDVAIATLELSEDEWLTNIIANLSGVEYDEVLRDPRTALAIINQSGMRLGKFKLKFFEPQATTLDEIITWMERTHPSAQVFVLDYIDKVVSPERRTNQNLSSYSEGLTIAEKWRLYGRAREMWLWTASQAQRRKDRKRNLDADDASLSLAKSQVADYIITLNYDPELDMLNYVIGKARFAKGRATIGPLPHDWGRGRMCPIDGFAPVRFALRTARAEAEAEQPVPTVESDDYDD